MYRRYRYICIVECSHLCSGLPSPADALDLDVPVLRSAIGVPVDDDGRLGGDEDGESGVPGPDREDVAGRRTDLGPDIIASATM